MSYRLRDNLFCCEVGGRIVFLDLAADRYFRLPSGEERVVRRYLAAEEVAAEDLQRLLAGKIIASATARPAPQPPLPAPRDIVLPTRLRSRKRAIARALAARVGARRRLRKKGLLPLIDEIRSGAARGDESAGCPEARMAALVAAFAESRAMLRSQDRCLPDSLAMMALCRREALSATLVFGVMLDPFAAHCWVQAGDVVITGDIDDARSCSPMLAVP